jgi:hypothetical protein
VLYDDRDAPYDQWVDYLYRETQGTGQVRQTLGSRVGATNTPRAIWQIFQHELDAEPCLNKDRLSGK